MFFAILTTPKITSYHTKNPLNLYKIRLQSNSIKIFKKSIQITQNTIPSQPHFPNKNQAFPAIRSSKNHPSTEPIKSHIENSNIKPITLITNPKLFTLISHSKIIQQEKSTLQLHTYLEESESDHRRLLL